MLRNYILPKRLKTTQHPGKKIEVWFNNKKIQRLSDVRPIERPFFIDFIDNLEELGWNVRLMKN